jgi:hypothetical protein
MSNTNNIQNISNTAWAYLAGMIDGEGYIAVTRHYKDKQKNISRRGYEIETKLTIASMNNTTLIKIRDLTGLGQIVKMMIQRKDEPKPYPNYFIRYNVMAQRIILPNVLPFLIHKKEIALIVLDLLDYRQKYPYPNEAGKISREKFYLEIEERYRCAVITSKPWLLTIVERGGKLKNRNLNLVKGYHEHTYIRNYEPNRYNNNGKTGNKEAKE